MASTTRSHDPILSVGSCDMLILDMVPVVNSLAAYDKNERSQLSIKYFLFLSVQHDASARYSLLYYGLCDLVSDQWKFYLDCIQERSLITWYSTKKPVFWLITPALWSMFLDLGLLISFWSWLYMVIKSDFSMASLFWTLWDQENLSLLYRFP